MVLSMQKPASAANQFPRRPATAHLSSPVVRTRNRCLQHKHRECSQITSDCSYRRYNRSVGRRLSLLPRLSGISDERIAQSTATVWLSFRPPKLRALRVSVVKRIPLSRSIMTIIKQDDLIQSVADALQFISYYHPVDFIRSLARAYEKEQSPAARDAIAQIADQLAHVRRGPSAHLPGHRHRDRLPQSRHERAVGCDHERRGHGQRRRSPRLSARAQQAACQRSGRSRRGSQEHQGQHSRRHQHDDRSRRQAGGDGGGQGRRLGGQIEVRHVESLGLRSSTGCSRRFRPWARAGARREFSASASAAPPKKLCCWRKRPSWSRSTFRS